jgi:acetyl esterase/lipase
MLHTCELWLVRALSRLPEPVLRDCLRVLGGAPLRRRGYSLDPVLAWLAQRAAARPPLHSLPLAVARRRVRAIAAVLAGRPRKMASIETRSIPGPEQAIRLCVYHPPQLDGARPLLLYFHQGGFALGDTSLCESFCTRLAETTRCVVVSVGYRVGPNWTHPAAHLDAYTAFAWARAHANALGGDPARLVVAGDGAGGTLAACVCQELRHREQPPPVLQLLVYPWLLPDADNQAYRDFGDAYPLTPEILRCCLARYAREAAARDDPRAWPLLAREIVGLPPTLLVTAGFDPLCDEGALYAQRLAAGGVDVHHRFYSNLCHGFTALGAVPAVGVALDEIASDVERFLACEALPRSDPPAAAELPR